MSKKANNIRSFKAIDVKKIGNNKYETHEHTLLKNNRYTIKNQQSPEDAAKKVFKRICFLKKDNCDSTFTLLETTRNGSKRLFFYKGKRIHISKNNQKKPVIFNDGRVVTFEYDHTIHAVPSNKLGHTNPLSDWKMPKKRK